MVVQYQLSLTTELKRGLLTIRRPLRTSQGYSWEGVEVRGEFGRRKNLNVMDRGVGESLMACTCLHKSRLGIVYVARRRLRCGRAIHTLQLLQHTNGYLRSFQSYEPSG
jgi:hypothetical protein